MSISVLIVDDSALMRNLVSKILEAQPDIRVAGRAMNGLFALQKIEKELPDVIILDLEMPQMNGIEFLKERRRRQIQTPVIILSSLAEKGARITMEALGLGAADFIQKPSGSVSLDLHTVAGQLVELVRIYGGRAAEVAERSTIAMEAAAVPPKPAAPAPAAPVPATITPTEKPGPTRLIAFGVSTGGPNALRKVFAEFPADIPAPIVVVQHMPAGFTEEFAKSLDKICSLSVRQAEDGALAEAGTIHIAPGNKHLSVERRHQGALLRLSDDPPRNGHRPSVDVLFHSVAKEYGNNALAVIMTGMGRDGADGMAEIRKRGGLTVGQDQETSIVYGMPRVAYEMGAVEHQVPLSQIAQVVGKLISSGLAKTTG
ncbi:MAG: chemotaxis response regulator protein-glutamate methylesterase [Spirochaetaceae bacterium]